MLGIAVCVILSTTIAFAAGATKIEAIVSGMKIYFNGKALKGDVLTAKGKTYLPMDILSNNLGFKLSADTKNKKFNISESVSKSSLQQKLTDIDGQNNELQAANAAITTERDSLKSDNENLKAQVADLTNQINDLGNKLASLQASERQINVFKDDNRINLTDDNGAPIGGIVKNGVIYLPVKALAQAFGKAYSYDGKASSIYMGKHESSTPSKYLSQLNPITSSGLSVGDASKDNMGNTYSNSIILGSLSNGSGEYVLDGAYSKFKGVFALPYNSKDDGTLGIFQVYGDGKLLYASTGMTKGIEPIKFDVDITGVNRLKVVLVFSLNGDIYHGWTSYILDAGLYQ